MFKLVTPFERPNIARLGVLSTLMMMTSSAYAATATLPNGAAVKPCVAVDGMGCVPGGAFLRGRDEPNGKKPRLRYDQAGEWPRETVHLQTFYMDKYEVTVEDYDACVKAKKCPKARTLYSDYSRPKQPKVGVSWYNAVQFCKAAGKHLPTEAEWEKAARGVDGRLYPWGDKTATCKEAVIKDRRGRSCGVPKKIGGHPEKGRTFVVGTRAPNQFGLFDMSGNSWEWVYDWASRSYAKCGTACQGFDPRGPCGGALKCKGHKHRVVRGGSWYWPAKLATTTFRRFHIPSNKLPNYHHFGFRCAASAAEGLALHKSGLPRWLPASKTPR